MMGWKLVCGVPACILQGQVYVGKCAKNKLLILTRCYFFVSLLSQHVPSAHSGSVSQLSLQPCDLISLTDCGCLGKVSLSTVPFLLRFTLCVTNSFWHPFEKQRSLLDSAPRFPHTQASAQGLSARKKHACMHSQVHTGACKHNTGRHKYTRRKRGRTVSPKQEHYASHSSPIHTHTPLILKVGSEKGSHV